MNYRLLQEFNPDFIAPFVQYWCICENRFPGVPLYYVDQLPVQDTDERGELHLICDCSPDCTNVYIRHKKCIDEKIGNKCVYGHNIIKSAFINEKSITDNSDLKLDTGCIPVNINKDQCLMCHKKSEFVKYKLRCYKNIKYVKTTEFFAHPDCVLTWFYSNPLCFVCQSPISIAQYDELNASYYINENVAFKYEEENANIDHDRIIGHFPDKIDGLNAMCDKQRRKNQEKNKCNICHKETTELYVCSSGCKYYAHKKCLVGYLSNVGTKCLLCEESFLA